MKISRSIEILETEPPESLDISDEDEEAAAHLGIEALKFRQRWEEQEGEEDFPLMPGQTKE